jgi:hypothetical protein
VGTGPAVAPGGQWTDQIEAEKAHVRRPGSRSAFALTIEELHSLDLSFPCGISAFPTEQGCCKN